MGIVVKKRDKETNASLLRRFIRKIQNSGNLIKARSGLFYQKKLTEREKRLRALYKEKRRKEIEYLKKLGKFEKILKKRK